MFLFSNTNLGMQQRIRLLRHKRRYPWAFYVPNRPLADTIRAIGTEYNKIRIFLMTSGNGVGKTSGTINMIANIVFSVKNVFDYAKDMETGEEFPGFFYYPLYQNFPSVWPHNIWYVSNRDSLASIWDEFKVWIPNRLMRASKNGKTHVDEVAFKGTDDWRLYFKTVDQDPKTFESANISIVIFDEPPPVQLFRAALFRLRRGGIIIIPATPLMTASWFVDEIIDRVKVDDDKYHQTVSMWENCLERCGTWDLGPEYGQHPKGVLKEKDIRFMIRNCDPDEVEARINGKFQHLTGVVYKTYSTANHFVQLKPIIDPTKYVYQFVVDPHERRPPAAIWIRIDQWGRRRIIREWPSRMDLQYHGLPFNKIKDAAPYIIEDFVRFWCEIEEELSMPLDRIQSIMDPNFGRKPDSRTGKLLHEMYAEEFDKRGRPRGFILDVVDELYTGHNAVKEALKFNQYGDAPLLISKECHNCDWGMRTYSYEPEPEGKAAQKRDIAIKVREIGKDFPDLIRYAVMVDCPWSPPGSLEPEQFGDYGDYKKSEPLHRGKGADFA